MSGGSGNGALVVSGGGAPATTVDPDALAAAAAVLAAAAERLAGAGLELAARGASPALLASAAVSPGTWARAQAALLAVAGPSGAPAAAARLTATAAALHGCAAAYRAVELAVLAGRRAAGHLAGRLLLPALAPLAAVLLADAAWRAGEAAGEVLLLGVAAVRDGSVAAEEAAGIAVATLELPDEVARRVGDDVRAAADPVGDWLAAHPGAVDAAVLLLPAALEGLLSAVPGLAPAVAAATGARPSLVDARDAARVLAGAGALIPLLRETPVRVERATSGPSAPQRPPRGVAELVDGVVRQAAGRTPTSASRGYPGRSPSGGTPPEQGQVRVERITAAGRTSWVVLVPGTQEWSPVTGSGRPAMDLTANVQSVAGHRTAPMRIVVEALRTAGARPGEPVLLAGHSQGGLTAVELAADPKVRAEFAITHVVTAGSPVALAEVPAGVRVLSLEHTEDLVTVLDGAPNPDTASWTTVRRDLAEDPRWSERVARDGLASHESLAYVDTAEVVDAADDPALRRWHESAAAFWDRPGAQVEVHDFRGVRR
ncbi:hypothetical protein CLV92_102278 [Kineococcus xinjiangensis]|uniref:PGAP1-like protein n=1 Tax=Kineococcus xinjiangensis TaxID=512762 RepID=A0A2S6IV20_9ACTN|nr:hypothetical protein [Kineococcus xinjiangensis]PPK98125.1 hypothetical protein CLV92_102278 [Kineococcus xinjiangensis]